MDGRPRQTGPTDQTKETTMTGRFAEKARTRRIVALQAMQAKRAGVTPKAVNLCTAKASRFPPIEKVLAALATKDPSRLAAA